MLKKILMGVSLTVVAATLAYAQNAPQGGAAPGAAPAAGARGGAAGGAAGARGGAAGAAAAPAGPRDLPTEAEWAGMNANAKAFVDKAKQIAGDDKDLKFDVTV